MLEIGRCCPSGREICFLGCWTYRPISITPVLLKVFDKIVAGKLNNCLERNAMLPSSQLLHRRGLGTCDVLLTLSHRLLVALDRDMEGRLVQLDLSAAFEVCCIS